MLGKVSTPYIERDINHFPRKMSFDALSQIEKHEAAELLYLKKAKDQRKAANALRKQYKIKMEAEVISIEEPAVPDVVVALPLAAPPPMPAESPAESPIQMPRDFKELPLQAPGAPVKKARKPLTEAHKAAMQAGRQKKKAEKEAAAAQAQVQEQAQEQPVNRVLEFVAEPVQAAVPQDVMVIGANVNNSKIFKLKGSAEERRILIANLLPERLTKGKPINWRNGTKHHPLSKWPAAILEQLANGICTKESICAAIQMNQKAFDDYVRELKHQNLIE
jgi:hypothetical protein